MIIGIIVLSIAGLCLLFTIIYPIFINKIPKTLKEQGGKK